MSMLPLRSVTLVAIDTRTPDLAMLAMQRSMAQIQFGDAILFGPPGFEAPSSSGIRLQPVTDIDSSGKYSEFVIRHLLDYVTTDHVLIVQWDGFVTTTSRWDAEFLSFDYIGAPWPQYSGEHVVGNGGFSLRSIKLMQAVKAIARHSVHPEDVCICRTYRRQLEVDFNLKFAPVDLALRFSCERLGDASSTFGCHGLSNMVDALPGNELIDFLMKLPSEVYGSTECRRLIKKLIASGHLKLALHALKQRRATVGRNVADARLWLRFYIARAFAGTLRVHDHKPR